MSKQRYVTLGVALCAALGVHALVLFYVVQPSVLLVDAQPMQIDLIPQLAPMQDKLLQEKALKENNKFQANKPIKNTAQNEAKHVDVFNSITIPENIAQHTNKFPKQENKMIEVPAQQPTQESALQTAQVVPKPIQQRILAAIAYPRQAMRRGWEGSAKFSLAVQQQVVQSVTLLVSTGYKTLDIAAQKGIASIGSLPLSDGEHILPVTFQLQ